MTSKKLKNPILSILVPVYNEERTLEEILKRVSVLPIDSYEIIIVDDASKDASPKIINNFKNNFSSTKAVLYTVRHKKNAGKGAGIQTALKQARGTYFVIQDADLEYYPEDIPALLDKALKGKHDVMYGSRFRGEIKGMPRPNFLANRFYNFLLRRLYDTDITDMHTCYKMVRTDLFRQLDIKSNGFGYATELVSKLLRRGYIINEAPIRFSGRTKKEGKKIDISDGVECIVNLVSFRFSKKMLIDAEQN